MFGYIVIHKDELKVKDYNRYNSFYCGVCRSLRNNYGLPGQITLNYDMIFLAILLSGLYEDDTKTVMRHCVIHHVKKHGEISNEYTDYAAAMNILLSYYKLKDNWDDDRSLKSNICAGLLKKAFKKAASKFPKQAGIIEDYISGQSECEKSHENNIDTVSSYTGKMLGGIFAMKDDIWKEDLYRMGFFLGKYIYIMDAFDDIDKDIKNESYNPLIPRRNDGDFNEYCKNILTITAAESARAFECLPIIDNIDILRNIMYAGIWTKYNIIIQKRDKDPDREV